MEPLVPMDKLRSDLRKRSEQLRSIAARAADLHQAFELLCCEVAALELQNSGGKRRRRRRGAEKTDKGPSVVEVALKILAERGAPMPCTELARAVAARGVDCGNNERSLRMSASKGKKLRSLPYDVIALA